MMVDYIKLCKEASNNAFAHFPIDEHQQEYDYAKDKYNILLLICCCFMLINKGQYPSDVYKIEQYLQHRKISISLVNIAYIAYTHHIEAKDYTFQDRDEINGYRLCEGNNIGEVLFPDCRSHYIYDMLVVDMWDELERVLEIIDK